MDQIGTGIVKSKRNLVIPCLLLLLALLPGPSAYAHQPVCEFADLTAASPWQVPDATISYAYFGNVFPVGDIDYFTFDAQAGQPVLLSLSIPAIPDLDVFSPLMAVFGPGVESDPAIQRPLPLDIPEAQNAMMIPLGDAPVHWYEPFGRVYFWNWNDYFFIAPETAAYTVALWHPADEIGRYTFVIGQREVFGGDADCFSTYSDYWTPLEAGVNPYRDTVLTAEMLLHASGVLHDHSAVLDVIAEGAPAVDLQVIRLSDGSYNVRVQTRNSVFTPQFVDMAAVPNEGHAHLYIDCVKIARIYGEWFHLPALPEAAEVLSVTLYADDHSAFAVEGAAISAFVALSEPRQEN